jgi:glycosyltransferase involved in cell wall biosynthesis
MGAVPSKLAQKQLFALEKRLYKSAAHIVPLSPDMAAYMEQLGVSTSKITTVLNGTDFHLAATATDEAVATLQQEQVFTNRRIILYAGTFGRANDIPTLVEAAEKMAPTHPDVLWVFMGHGFNEPLIQAAAARCTSIRLIAPQPRHVVFTWFRLAEISIVSFLDLPVLDANSPAKFYDSLAVGTPVIVTNNGWTRQWVEKHSCGWYSPAGNADALASCVSALLANPAKLKQAGLNGQSTAHAHFDRQELAATMQTILESAAKQ